MTGAAVSARDPLVARAARLLRDGEARRAEGAVAVAGDDLLTEALLAGVEVDAVLEDPAHASEPARWRSLLGDGVVPTPAGADALRALAALGAPPRVLAICRLHEPPAVPPVPDAAVVLCEVGDEGDVGSIIRTAAALNIPRVIPCGAGADPFSPGALRASQGGAFRLDLVSGPVASLAELAAMDDRPALAATVHAGGLEPEGLPADAAVVLGRERRGLTREEIALCEFTVTIPAPGFESLNVAAAAAILMWERSRPA
jgi:TrmH family RNA methyltransferase